MPTDAKLRALVERYRVCWESFPEWSQTNHERRQSGVVIELYGTHHRPSTTPTAGCKDCFPVLRALLEIADALVKDLREPLVSIRAHSGIEYANERGGRPDIVVALTLRSPDSGLDGDLGPSLTKIRASLAALGANERSWRADAVP